MYATQIGSNFFNLSATLLCSSFEKDTAMSEKIKYQFAAMPIQWVKDYKLTAVEKVILLALISFKENLGYESLGSYAGISKRQCIRLTQKLERFGYIEINNHTRPAKIRVCLENLGGDLQGKGDTGDTISKNKGDTGDTIKVTPATKKGDTGDTLNRFKYINYINSGGSPENQKATADGAAVRSMPDAGQAGGTVQQGNQARFDLSDLNDAKYCLANVDKFGHFRYLFANNRLFFRPYTVFNDKINEEEKNNVISFFKEKCGKKIDFLAANEHVAGEQIIV